MHQQARRSINKPEEASTSQKKHQQARRSSNKPEGSKQGQQQQARRAPPEDPPQKKDNNPYRTIAGDRDGAMAFLTSSTEGRYLLPHRIPYPSYPTAISISS
jgi:hypothetical protein